MVSPKIPLDYRVRVRNRGQGPVGDMIIRARLGQPVDTRSELAGLLAAPGAVAAIQPLDEFRPEVATIAPGTAERLERRQVPLPPGLADDRAGVVLPLSVEVQATDAAGQPVSASLTTFVVDLPARAIQPLRAALLVPVREPTHRNPAGDFIDDKLAELLARAGSLGAIAAELARAGAPEATMVVDAMLVEEATAMVGGWRLREKGKRTTIPPGDPRSGNADQFLQSLKKAASRAAASGTRRPPSPTATPTSRRWSGWGAATEPRAPSGSGATCSRTASARRPTSRWPGRSTGRSTGPCSRPWSRPAAT